MHIAAYSILAVILVAVAYLSLSRPSFAVPKDITWLRNTPIAHRGLHTSEFDENSLGAFSNAIANGYGIELDVRLTKDDVVVVVHDDDLDRLFGVDNSVSKMTLAELKGLKLPKSGEEIPTFAEVLAHVNGQTPILIEVKDFRLPGKLETKVLGALKGYEGGFALQSFNPLVCRWLRKNDPGLVVGLLLDDFPLLKSRYGRNLKDNLFSAISRPNFVAYRYGALGDEAAQAYRAQSVTVLGWGVTQGMVVNKALQPRVDNVIFDLESDPR
jgi:glycerophosphoryl diester phosphodiesterase